MKSIIRLKVIRLLFAASIAFVTANGAMLALAGHVTHEGEATCFTQSPSEASQQIDFANAKAKPLPAAAPAIGPLEGGISAENSGEPGSEPGSVGTGKMIATPPGEAPQTGSEAETSADSGGAVPQEYGTANIPYTTSRVDLTSANNESKSYPYRAAGKLYFNEPGGSYVCSASLIKRGIVVTAGHCVANFGKSTFYSGWQFRPGMSNGASGTIIPYGTWSVSKAWVLTSYYNGTDSCSQSGVVCKDDVAVLALTPQSGALPGTSAGWLGYGWNGWGFTPGNTVQITQLGYPVSADSGLMMQRTDSQGFVSSSNSNCTVWGSRQTGGSSGGPEVANFGVAAELSGTAYGTYSNYNYVIGVTSWGSTTDTVKQEGASSFTSGNVQYLVNQACAAYPANCK
jgi:V8-like Glu-specific endopeptidase